MALEDSKGALMRATKDLMARWAAVQNVWQDTQSAEFEKTYLAPFEQDVRSALLALDRMGQVIAKIEQDCG